MAPIRSCALAFSSSPLFETDEATPPALLLAGDGIAELNIPIGYWDMRLKDRIRCDPVYRIGLFMGCSNVNMEDAL